MLPLTLLLPLAVTVTWWLPPVGDLALAAGPPRLVDLRAPGQARVRARELAQAAFAAHGQGDEDRALALLDEAEALYPNQADGYNLRGAVHLRRGDYTRASSAFARAAALDPDLWAAKFNLADVPFKQKDYPRARVLFDRLVDGTDRYKATAQWELAQYKAGVCCLLAGDEVGAVRRLSRLGASPTVATTTGGASRGNNDGAVQASLSSAASFHAQAALAFARRDTATANRLLAAAQVACKPAANALYLPSLVAAGWVTPVATPASMPTVGNPGTPGGSRLRYLPGNLPITEPELPGGASGLPATNALTGGGGGRPVPEPTPLVLPAAKLLVDPSPVETPTPVAAVRSGVPRGILPVAPVPTELVPGREKAADSPEPTPDPTPAAVSSPTAVPSRS